MFNFIFSLTSKVTQMAIKKMFITIPANKT